MVVDMKNGKIVDVHHKKTRVFVQSDEMIKIY